jgi:hypothetical protein
LRKTQLDTEKKPPEKRASDFLIHLSMDDSAHDLLRRLKDDLDASSLGEVIRRALRALDRYEPSDPRRGSSSKHELDRQIAKTSASNTGRKTVSERTLRLVSVRISPRTKAHLDRHKGEHTTYADVVSDALRVLAQLRLGARSQDEEGSQGEERSFRDQEAELNSEVLV